MSKTDRILNPLKLFPSKAEPLSNVLIKSKNSKFIWLDPLKRDPTFSIDGVDVTSSLRKTFRRVETKSIFQRSDDKYFASTRDNISSQLCSNTAEISIQSTTSIKYSNALPLDSPTKSSTKRKEFILVEASRLKELAKYEKILRQERKMLGQQCSWLIAEEQISPSLAIPAVRMAIHDMCETQLRALTADTKRMEDLWHDYYYKNRYHRKRKHVYTASYIDHLPLIQRAKKVKEIREEDEEHYHAMERDMMMHEDGLSAAFRKYLNIIEFREDYDRYYILAYRFGGLREIDFIASGRPGERYLDLINHSATVIRRAWKCYIARWLLKKHRCCKKIQATYRRHRARKKYCPLISMRKKCYSRNNFAYRMESWRDYNRRCRLISTALRFCGAPFLPQSFKAWKILIRQLAVHRNAVLDRGAVAMKISHLARLFQSWRVFLSACRRIHTFMKRNVMGPLFHRWISYNAYNRLLRRLNKAAVKIQARIRTYLARKHFLHLKKSVRSLESFGQIVLARKKRRIRAKSQVDREFDIWLPQEMDRQTRRANDREQKWVIRRQKYLNDSEKDSLDALRKHLETRDGKMQLDRLANELGKLFSAAAPGAKQLPQKELLHQARTNLLTKCSEFCTVLHKHDFNARNPVPFICADVTCGAVFATEEQYHSHMTYSEKHCDGQSPQYSSFHVMLRSGRGQEAIRRFVLRVDGLSVLANRLDMWILVQEWSKLPSKSDQYTKKALFIYDTFLKPGSLRFVDVDCGTFDTQIMESLQKVQNRQFEGFYTLEHSDATGMRSLVTKKTFEAWTVDNIVPGDVFDVLEWHVFLLLFNAVEDRGFGSSHELALYREAVAETEKQRREQLFQEFLSQREERNRKWTEDYMLADRERAKFAEEAMDVYVEKEVLRVLGDVLYKAVGEAAHDAVYELQKAYETTSMIADEAVWWVESAAVEELYAFYSSVLVNSMWEIAGFRKLLLDFSGLYYSNDEACNDRLQDRRTADRDDQIWFSNFLKAALAEEKGSRPLGPDEAALRIQVRVRGMQGRKVARRVFVRRYGKRYDASSQTYYYEDMVTGEVSWYRPYITRYLLPHSTW